MNQTKKVLMVSSAVVVLAASLFALKDTLCPSVSAAVPQCRTTNLVADATQEELLELPVQLQPIQELGPRYYTYSPEALDLAHEVSDKVILYFWAPWCTTCASLDIEIEQNPDIIPEDAVVLRIPYDSASELKKRYNVTIQHTFVLVDENNEPLNLVVGGDPVDVLNQ